MKKVLVVVGRALVYSMYGHWLCEEFNPEDYFGFVYEIIDTTNDSVSLNSLINMY